MTQTAEDSGFEIGRGNTVEGVNRLIIELLTGIGESFEGKRLLDLPCGEGCFLDAAELFLHGIETVGADICERPKGFRHEYFRIDASREFDLARSGDFFVATCISGVMEFDNTQAFFERINSLISTDGYVIVTNDNLTSVKDRLNYLLFGRYAQYKAFIGNDRPTWKTISMGNLIRLLEGAGLSIAKIEFVKPRIGDWLWLPIALPIYVAQTLYCFLKEREVAFEAKKRRFPFLSLLSRHYVVVCRPKRRH